MASANRVSRGRRSSIGCRRASASSSSTFPVTGDPPATDSYDVVDLAGDVMAAVASEGIENARFVGHSLGGVVVSAAAASGAPVRSVVNVDQPLKLDDFQDGLQAAAPALRDPASFPQVMNALFDGMTGDVIGESERDRLAALRRLDQDVVLGIWSPVLDSTRDALAERMETMCACRPMPVPGDPRDRSRPRVRGVAHRPDPHRHRRGLGGARALPPSGRSRPVRASARRVLGHRLTTD